MPSAKRKARKLICPCCGLQLSDRQIRRHRNMPDPDQSCDNASPPSPDSGNITEPDEPGDLEDNRPLHELHDADEEADVEEGRSRLASLHMGSEVVQRVGSIVTLGAIFVLLLAISIQFDLSDSCTAALTELVAFAGPPSRHVQRAHFVNQVQRDVFSRCMLHSHVSR